MKKLLYKIFKIYPTLLMAIFLAMPISARADSCPAPSTGDSACLFCPMFKIFFQASASVAKASYDTFHSSLGELILVFLFVALALIVLKNVASMGARDPGSILNDLFTKAFTCAAIYIIVTQDYFNILNMTITPIIQDGLGFVGSNPDGCRYMETAGGYAVSAGSLGGEAMPSELGTTIICAIDEIEQKINLLFAYGNYAFCLGTGPAKILFHFFPNPLYIIDAVILYLGGVFFLIGYPWILADAVLQMGISFALLPFAVAGYAFSKTKNYLNKTFQWILNSLFTFIFMAILINCVLGYIAQLLHLVFDTTGDSDVLFTDPNRGVAFFGPNMIKIIFILAIGWVYMPLMRSLSDQFAQGSQLSAAKKVGTVLTDAMEKNVDKAKNWATDAAISAGGSAISATNRRVRAASRRVMTNVTEKFGHDDGHGNKVFTIGGRRAPKWLTGGMEFKVEKDSSGNKILKREFTSITGRKHVMISDRYSTIKEEYTKSGVLVKREVKFKHNFIKKHLLDEKGKINTGAVQTIFDSAIGQDPEYRKAIMEQLAVQILKGKGKDVGKYFSNRNVTFDPSNPTQISIQQTDHKGRETKFSVNFDMTTGQTAVSYATSHKHSDLYVTKPVSLWGLTFRRPTIPHTQKNEDVELFFSNGLVDISTSGERVAGSSTILREVTSFRYSADAQKGHDSLLIDDDSNQIVNNMGDIADNLKEFLPDSSRNPNYLLYGMDSVAGVSSIGGQSMPDFILHNVLQRGRTRQTNKFATNIAQYFI